MVSKSNSGKTVKSLLALVVVLCLVSGTHSQNINCTSMLHSTSTTQDTTPCTCTTPYAWNSTAKVCGVSCSLVAASTQVAVSPFECGCPTGSKWFNATIASGSPTCAPIDCTKIGYTDKTAVTAGGACTCVNRFTWNATVKLCTIDCAAITPAAGGATTPKLLADGICQCAANYSWDVVTMSCVRLNCSLIQYIFPGSTVTSSGTCLCDVGFHWDAEWARCSPSCGTGTNTIKYSTGVNPANPLACLCITNFYWVASVGQCIPNCTLFTNTNGAPANSYGNCTCVSPYSWNISDPNNPFCYAPINCNNVVNANTTAAQPTPSSCACNTGFSWNSVTSTCNIDCTGIANVNASGAHTATACVCNSAFDWVSANRTCKINCARVTNANSTGVSTDTSCTCNIGYTWKSATLTCEVDCTTKSNVNSSNTSTPPANTCNCNSGYVWSASAMNCVLNCVGISHTNTSTVTTGPTCVCETGYNWTGSACQINCAAIAKTNNQTGPTLTTCTCVNAKYAWDTANNVCQIQCASITNALATPLPADRISCTCSAGYVWNGTSETCIFDCSTVLFNAGAATGGCACITGFVWTPQTCNINCSTFLYALVKTGSTTACNCNSTKEVWMNVSNAIGCYMNCSTVPFANTATVKFSLAQTCECLGPRTYSMVLMRCMLDCTKVVDAIGKNSDTSCICRIAYRWNATALTCTLDCTLVTVNSPKTADGAGGCNCNAGYTWNSTAGTCDLSPP